MNLPFCPNLHRHDLLAKLLALFAVSSIISLAGIAASRLAYKDFFTTFVSRIGIRTILYHLIVLHFRQRDPHVFENIFNIATLLVLCVIWVGGGIWSFFYEADIWGHKTCKGCPGWELLRKQGDWAVALESIVLGACLVLCIQSRIKKRAVEQ
ncbi:hypothetical protein FRC12_023531, partial [Ceratobasidium sp. 428]